MDVSLTRKQGFALDAAGNPHPRMLAGAIEARRLAKVLAGTERAYYWAGYLQAMADATGEPLDALNAWIDRHEAP